MYGEEMMFCREIMDDLWKVLGGDLKVDELGFEIWRRARVEEDVWRFRTCSWHLSVI